MSRKILIAATSHAFLGTTGKATGAYVSEMAHPWATFINAGYEVELVSVRGGAIPLDGVDRNDAVNAHFLDDKSIANQLRASRDATQINPRDYAAIFFAGGHGTMWDFPNAHALLALARDIYQRDGVIGAVCHGPAALVNLTLSDGRHLVAGKAVAAFTNAEESAAGLTDVVPFLLHDGLAARGARLHAAANWAANVITDGRLVTGQNPASAAGVAQAMLRVLHG